MIKTIVIKVEFLQPGSFFPEGYTEIVANRIPANLKNISKNTYAIRYYNEEIIKDCGKTYKTNEAINESKRIVFGTKIHFKKIEDTHENRILRSNLECNGYRGYGIKCITGNWQPFLKADIVLKSHKEIKTLIEEI